MTSDIAEPNPPMQLCSSIDTSSLLLFADFLTVSSSIGLTVCTLIISA